MKIFSNIISFVFHPLFILVYILLLLMAIDPWLFRMPDKKVKVIFFTYTFVSLIVIPVISILILKQLNVIKSFRMESKSERIAPLIIVGIVYMWLFINYKNTGSVPLLFAAFLLGSVFSVFSAFFINNFTKISIHTIGAGGLVAAIFLMATYLKYQTLYINLGSVGKYSIHIYFILLISILVAGLIGTVRLYLNAHSSKQVYLGYLIGFLSQVIAF
ncbi:MAG TPA: hypothetical protein ENK91_10665, partial [Bacteroidetes bacterium]|nr:hypothetical protein [Bacteroidota bacterium]